MKIFIICILLSVISIPNEGIREKIETFYSSTKSISADFKMTKKSSMLKNPVVKNGKFYYQDKSIKWMINTPVKNTILITPEMAKSKTGNQSPTNLKGFSFIRKFMFGLMQGEFLNNGKFTTTIKNIGNGLIELKSLPKDKRVGNYIYAFVMNIDEKSYLLKELTIIEKSGDQIVYEFFNLKRNSDISPSVFKSFH